MKIEEAKIGTRVKTKVAFSGVPLDTEGVIDDDYGAGVMVAWDLPNRPLPQGYNKYDGKWAIQTGILRDGFDKKSELQYLEKVR